jgi:hypothetical protein
MATLDTFLGLNIQATLNDQSYAFGPEKLRAIFPFVQATLANADASKIGVLTVAVPNAGDTTKSLISDLRDPRGNVVTFTELLILALYNADEDAFITVGGAASAPFEDLDGPPLGPGAVRLFYEPDGMILNPSVSANLKLTNLGTSGIANVHLFAVGN